MNEDESHLSNLALAHYIVGGIMAFFACLPLIHMSVGLAFILGADSFFAQAEQPPPPFFGWLFFGIGLFFFVIGQTVSIAVILSGRFIKRRKNYLFTFILACVACTFVPLGTILGVFTIIILSRDSVKAIYAHQQPGALGEPARGTSEVP